MALLGSGYATPEKREGRARLSVRGPQFLESMLAGISIEGFNVEETRRFGNALLRARDDWARQYRGGKRYSDDAPNRERNSLAGWQNGGRK
jgi:hypothetical protein